MPPKPKTILKRTTLTEYARCQWESCHHEAFSSFRELAEHVNREHVDPMVDQDMVYCLWKECRMFKKPCYSHEWLQRHIRMHTGEKPFKCIIVGCSASFLSTEALSKHVETHFKERRKSLGQVNKIKVGSQKKPKPAKKSTNAIVKPVGNEAFTSKHTCYNYTCILKTTTLKSSLLFCLVQPCQFPMYSEFMLKVQRLTAVLLMDGCGSTASSSQYSDHLL